MLRRLPEWRPQLITVFAPRGGRKIGEFMIDSPLIAIDEGRLSTRGYTRCRMSIRTEFESREHTIKIESWCS